MEPEHTEVNITKPKKERTPAQKAATARALEALAAKRKQTKEAIAVSYTHLTLPTKRIV